MRRVGQNPVGFLTASNDDEGRYYGGLLVIDPLGRPLEFHCTAPVAPSRAHAILYGPALIGHVCGNLIAPALIAQARVSLAALFVDRAEFLVDRSELELPVALASADNITEEKIEEVVAAPGVTLIRTESFQSYSLWVHPEFHEDGAQCRAAWHDYLDNVELMEPFERIRQALDEARQGQQGQGNQAA